MRLTSTGCNITVVDLRALLRPSPTEPAVFAQFAFAKGPPPSALKFSEDGTALAVCARDGHTARVYQRRPAPSILRRPPLPLASSPATARSATEPVRRASSASSDPGVGAEHLADAVQPVYTLRRGRTSAIVEGAEWAHDRMRFVLGTRKRTIHVFAVKPAGGQPDGSRLAGRVVNSQDLVSGMCS